ncbi:PfaB family protein [Deltaproteobacteria bacterium TL4]
MEKIAVIGVSSLFPGAQNAAEFWNNLLEKKDSRTEATAKQMGVDARRFYDQRKGILDKYYCLKGGYINDFQMDPTGFEIAPETIEALDEVFQWSLYVAKEALKDSGYLGKSELLKHCGVILGNLSFPTKSSNQLFIPLYHQTIELMLQKLLNNPNLKLPPYSPLKPSALENAMISGYPSAVIAKALSLKGVHFSLDAACASSLYSVKLACDYLSSYKMDMMLAGAVSAADPFFVNMGFSIFQAYPETAESLPLDTRSKGLFAGEGAGMFVLKRYKDALRDQDRIYATIIGGGLSNDGKGQFVLSPNPKGQAIAFEKAYADAGVEPSTVDYLECHATGTPLGDKVELGSIDKFFGKHQASPLIGSVKSNLGHLLTAAGMPGMLKAIQSMQHGIIPPTINVQTPTTSPNRVITPQQIPVETRSWPHDRPIRRAGVSAFGFGGCNAHLVFEKDTADLQKNSQEVLQKPKNKTFTPMAIVGMESHFGSCEGVKQLHHTIYDGSQHFVPLPAQRWKGIDGVQDILRAHGFEEGKAPQGAYIEAFEIDFLRYKIPPNENDQLISQQLLMLKVADQALQDSPVAEGGNVAVLIAMGTELALHQYRGRANMSSQFEEMFQNTRQTWTEDEEDFLLRLSRDSIHNPAQLNQYTSFIGNIMASRISSIWDFTGPAFTISAEENSVFKALDVAQMLLDSRDVDAVVVGAVDLAGGLEHVLFRNQLSKANTGVNTLGFDRQANGWLVGEGAGAIVLKRQDDAMQAGERIYASLNALGFSHGLNAESFAKACRSALDSAGIQPSEVEYVEAFGSGMAPEDEAEIQGLTQVYQKSESLPSCALGSIKANIGHTFTASGIASIIKTALCLYHRFIPETPQWHTPKVSQQWENSAFYVPTESKTWFSEPDQTRRIAAVNSLGQDGVCCHLILSKEISAETPANYYLSERPVTLIPLVGSNLSELQKGLNSVEHELQIGNSLPQLAEQAYQKTRQQPEATLTLALVAQSPEEFQQEVKAARQGIHEAYQTGEDWTSLRGSYFTPKPLGKEGKIAFVYPGGFTSYVGVGRDLFQLFPELHGFAETHTSRLKQMVGDTHLYPRSMSRLSESEVNALNSKLISDHAIMMFESGISFSVLYTDIIRKIFGIEPQLTLGYSMGEVTMMYALNAWSKTDEMSEILHTSPVFRTRLAGPMETVREAWNIPADQDPENTFWRCYTLIKPASEISPLVAKEERVFLIFINTPEEVVIAGDQAACLRVIAAADCDHFPVPMGDVMHCELVKPDYEALKNLHLNPVNPPQNIDFYSAVGYAPITIDRENIAHNIAQLYCGPVDFNRLVQQAYEDGARTFIELGPRGSCTSWIGRILKDQEHIAVGIDRKGAGEAISILRALAKLYSHQIPMDLSPLFQQTPPKESQGRSLVKTVQLGGKRLEEILLAEDNIKYFTSLQHSASSNVAFSTERPVTPMFHKPAKSHEKSQLETKVKREPVPKLVERPQTQKPIFSESPLLMEKALKVTSAQQTATPGSLYPFKNIHFQQLSDNLAQVSNAHSAFLQGRQEMSQQVAELIKLQTQLLAQSVGAPTFSLNLAALAPKTTLLESPPMVSFQAPSRPEAERKTTVSLKGPSAVVIEPSTVAAKRPAPHPVTKPKEVIWDEADLVSFAEGNIADVFGKEYAVIDSYRRRVRLPTTDYLLVSRVTKLNAKTNVFEPCSITTEYDIPHHAWYSIDGQIPWAVAVESGQCDLLLISYLGIDFQCKGERVYRLLDCTLTFLDHLPKEGQTLRYDIKINAFAKSGDDLLFFFSYECFVGDKMVLKMDGGCAGFFTDKALAEGKGIIETESEKAEKRKIPKQHFTPLLQCQKTSFEKEDLLHFIQGKPSACFGPSYDQRGCNSSLRFAAEKMLMIERIVSIDTQGGAWGLGMVIAEKRLEPEHWYFPCHFKDDQVMAGSLMAEGCCQLLQFFALYLGLQTQTENACFQPMLNLPQKVRCRGQVLPQSNALIYRMEVTEIGLDPVPYAKANVDIILNEIIVVDFKGVGVQMVEMRPGTKTQRPEKNLQVPEKEPLFSKYHLEQFATGSIAACFGPEFAVYDERQPPRTPNGDLQLTDRVWEVKGQRHEFKKPASVVAEYEVPADVWFFKENSHPSLMPYSLLMEIALQPCGFISAYVGTTLIYPDTDFYFRNLDGQGHLLKEMDLRGKTITIFAQLNSTVASGSTIIQSFEFHLSHQGERFYEGTAVFGYFIKEMLVNQLGLDGGKCLPPWHIAEQIPEPSIITLDLKNKPDAIQKRYFEGTPDKPYYHLARPQLNFLDEVKIVENGGKKQKGYIFASKTVDVHDWFFPFHFHQDPVMPGSLGVEGIMQAMQVFALHQDLGARFRSPKFHQNLGTIKWKYRGQIIPANKVMTLDVSITQIEETPEKVSLTANANLYKDGLRIYEITDLVVCLVEA